MKAGDAFCNNCGASVGSSTPSTPQPAAPAQPAQPAYQQPQQTYQQPQTHQYGTQPTQMYQAGQPPPMNKDADNALVWGIVSLFCTLAAIPAIIFGFRGLQNPYNKGKAVAGLVIGFIVLGIAVVGIILNFVLPYAFF